AIQLKSEVGVEGNYEIKADGFEFIAEYTCVILEDKLSHKMIDLKKDNTYSFNSKTTDSPDRFIVHFSKNNFCSNTLISSKGVTAFENEVNVTTTTEGNLVNFSFAESTPVVIEVMNMLGQDIVSAKTVVGNTQSEKVVLPAGFSGIYLLKISSEKGTIVKKFYK
ncbi:MAG: T9SS type A sorting domain-containing protein, partial [Bacteroidetes bacterium]|nr:T9SS type A sorting domain-containing protein [Bacteroidota bacterium]